MDTAPITGAYQPQLLAPAVKAGDGPKKIQDAAQQFEGLLLAQVLQQAHQDGGWLDSGSDSAGSVATGFAEQQLAAAIAHNGGLGLATMIASGLDRMANAAPGPSAAQPSRP